MSTVYLIAVGLLIICSYHDAASNKSDEAVLIYGKNITVLQLTSQNVLLPSSCPDRTDCMPVTSCDVALQDIGREKYPTICGWSTAGVPVVCCPQNIEEGIPVQPEEESPHSPQGCGKRQITGFGDSGRITDTKKVSMAGNATLGAWPWMAAVYTLHLGFETYIFGATIISKYYIVTAGHNLLEYFIRGLTITHLSVRVGSIHVHDGAQHSVAEIKIHHDYVNGRAYNDIGLIRVREPIQFGPDVQPICLPTSPEMRGKELRGRSAAVAGWGILQPPVGETQNEEKALEEITVQVIDPQTCNRIYNEPKKSSESAFGRGITDQFLCSVDGKGTCEGNSGAPMMVFENDTWVLVGVITYNYRCKLAGFPGVYTRVTSYVDWLLTETASA